MGMAVLLIFGLMALIVIASNVSYLFGGGPGLMRELGERFPAQPEGTGGVREAATMVMQRVESSPDPRRRGGASPKLVRVRLVLDEKHLHVKLDAGILGPDRRASVPWDVMTLVTRTEVKHWGEMASVEAGGFMLGLPSHLIVPYVVPGGDSVVDVDFREVGGPG